MHRSFRGRRKAVANIREFLAQHLTARDEPLHFAPIAGGSEPRIDSILTAR
jgi:hypothetical protein